MASGFQGRGVEPRPRLLFREAEKPLTLAPSAFQEEMSLTTKQRLARAKKLPLIVQPLAYHDKVSAAEPKQSVLQPCPAEVVFQKYSPGEVCEVPVVLRNMDKVSHLVKVTLQSSPYFQLVGPSAAYRKVPPGLSTTVHVLFTPGHNKDYSHQLLCVTEGQELIVPIRAIGARAILDFPDQLDFSQCAVKYITQKTLLVRNAGDLEAHFQLSTQSPFSVIPATGTLGSGDSMQVTVGFLPLRTGDYSTSLVVHYDTGEDTHTSLCGRAVDVDIRLDRNSVTAEQTYMTLSHRATVLIHNRSDVTACFQWKAVSTQGEEDQLKLRQYYRLCQQTKDKLSDFLVECGVDATGQERFALLARSLQSERAKVGEDPMLLCDDVFSLEPKEGEIRPRCWAEISVFFKPQAARVYERTVYCEVTGRENRLPLQLRGEGLAPRLRLVREELNVEDICVTATPKYEALLFNKGPIKAQFRLVPPTTARGSCFTFLPQEGILAPKKLQAIKISFCATTLGEFQEEFCFHVTGSPKPLTLTIRGCVVGPTLLFDVPALHFGDVSFGFPHTLECRLSNASLAHMPVNLRIAGDGSGELSMDSITQMGRHGNQAWRKGARGSAEPREFSISPCRTTLHALQSQLIKITLCSNTAREYKLELVVDVIGVGQKWLVLPLTARCTVPALRVLDPVMWFDHCCLKFPYEEKVTLVNDSDFRGCYRLLSQEHKEKAPAWYSSPMPSGIIEAHSSVQIPIALEAQQLGECNVTAEVAVFGTEGSPLELHLQCIAHGPVVHVHPREIDFGTLPVLEDRSNIIHLENHSVIPAPFRVEMARKRSCWRIDPSEGVIQPKSVMLVTVTASLDDAREFKDKVKVFIENGRTTIIPVQAVGIGTTIVTDKNLDSGLDLKSHFSCSPCCFQFSVTNRGRRVHRLYWSTESVSAVGQSTRPALRGKKSRNASRSRRHGSPVFKVHPLQVDLRPGQSVEMVLEGCSSTAQEVKERLLCYATMGKGIEKKPIMQVDVTCNFICPAVEVSSREITFHVEKKPSDVLTLQYQPLSVKNVCSLPFSILLYLEPPFQVCSEDQQFLPADSKPMMLDVGEELNLCIQFNPAYEKDLQSRVAERVLMMCFMEHPHEEQITVRGEVYFPNLDLESELVDFGCIINDTEQELHMEMTNCGPIAAQYQWSLLTDRQVNTIRFKPSPPKFKQQSSKKDGGFLRRYSKTESVEEPTKTPKPIQNSAQQPADAEDSLEAEVLPSPAVEPQGLVRKRACRRFSGLKQPKPSMREVFDVQPLWGVLQPGESHTVTFTFFGHANIVARATALCHVQGGPTYQVVVTGEASPLATNWMWKRWTEGRSSSDDLVKSDEDKERESSKYSSEDKA